jgi:hypothetical protein
MIKLSQTSKLGCKSWSLIARDHCPGSKGDDGQLVPACSGCYAAGGNYRFANVKAPRLHNAVDWKRADWVDDMVQALQNDRYFRWFDSGDMAWIGLAEKILEVMQRTPWCNHWLPTRMHKFSKFRSILTSMEALPNVVVRYSSDSIDGELTAGATTSTIVGSIGQLPAGAALCEAYQREGKCGSCRACWSKDVSVIAYPAHGRVMLSIIAKGA